MLPKTHAFISKNIFIHEHWDMKIAFDDLIIWRHSEKILFYILHVYPILLFSRHFYLTICHLIFINLISFVVLQHMDVRIMEPESWGGSEYLLLLLIKHLILPSQLSANHILLHHPWKQCCTYVRVTHILGCLQKD